MAENISDECDPREHKKNRGEVEQYYVRIRILQ